MSPFGIFFAPVPELLWSAYSGKPFVRCIDCEVPLLEANVYVVQKRFVGGEAVFEMAMCERCRDRMTQEYSEETRQNVTRFMAEQFRKGAAGAIEDLEKPQIIEVREIEDPEDGHAILRQCLDFCFMCGKERQACHRYSMAGLCRDTEVVAQITPVSRTPLMICETCEQGMADLISKKTRESWDRFVEEHFDGPPGTSVDLPDSYPVAF